MKVGVKGRRSFVICRSGSASVFLTPYLERCGYEHSSKFERQVDSTPKVCFRLDFGQASGRTGWQRIV